MKAGFTGTRQGLTVVQRESLVLALRTLKVTHFIHGDCIGADAEAHACCIPLGISTEAYPCDIARMRAWTKNDITHDPAPPLVRNQYIVNACEFLIACPAQKKELMRSGTWSTIRKGKKSGKPVLLVFPDGHTSWVGVGVGSGFGQLTNSYTFLPPEGA